MNSIFPTQLPHIEELYTKKDRELSNLVGKLQLPDVKEDKAFESTITRVKEQLLLREVRFADPIIRGHRQEEKKIPSNFNRLWGGVSTVQIVTVIYNFSGSAELLSYAPNGLHYSSSDTGVYQPQSSNVIIEVEVPVLDKQEVITRANAMMKTTFSLIKQNNPQASQWSAKKTLTIDELLNSRRKELIAFYS